jgi:hypothetical protein
MTQVEEEEQPIPPPEEVEAVSSPSFSDWSSSDDDSKRNLEDDKDAATEMPEDSPCLEWWGKVEPKVEEEEKKMLEEQEALLESFATARKEERTRAALTQAVCVESSPHGHDLVPAFPQFPVGRFAEVVHVWKAAAERRKAFEGDASCSTNVEGATTAAATVISSDEEK